jgi:hypothetical protein
VILSHDSRNRFSYSYEFVFASGVMRGPFSKSVARSPARGMRMAVHANIHRCLSDRNRVQRCLEQCRVDAIADLTELENEPNCLNSEFPVRRHISFILW